ncbi:MAG: septum formation initiator family protein [Firmicutes bacterium]|nr:septum formation initiator family protein [Bacillota bacterium]MBQ6607952.1 septum formation initiator family protein [Bacillota bacterium]
MADKKGELANFQARKRKLNVWKVAVLVILVLVIIYFVMSAVKIINLNREKAELEEENRKLKETVEDLKLQQETIHTDQYLEGLARRQLRLVKKDELLFVLPEIRKANEGEDSVFKGSTERAAEEGEANRKLQEAQAAQEADEGETAEGEDGEGQGDETSGEAQEGGSEDNNG